MEHTATDRPDAAFVDTPKGMFTASGVWFRAREEGVRVYAGEVLERASLDQLVRQAETWLRSPQTVALWLLPALLFVLPVWPAVLAALVVYFAWRLLGPSFVNRPMLHLFGGMQHMAAQFVYYVAALSVLAAGQQYAALAAGLVGFALLRWGVVRWATGPLIQRLWLTIYRLPPPDQVLRAVIRRAAIKYRIALPELDEMGRDILSIWHN